MVILKRYRNASPVAKSNPRRCRRTKIGANPGGIGIPGPRGTPGTRSGARAVIGGGAVQYPGFGLCVAVASLMLHPICYCGQAPDSRPSSCPGSVELTIPPASPVAPLPLLAHHLCTSCPTASSTMAAATAMAAGSAVSSFAAQVSSSSLEGKRSTVFGTSLRTFNVVPQKSAHTARTVVTKAQLSSTGGKKRSLVFASKQSLSYLDGTLPGDYGFDPLGLMDPEGAGGFIDPQWLTYAELINGRFAMLGAAGSIAPEILGRLGLIPQQTAVPWFRSGVIPPAGNYSYWADPYTLFVFEIALMGFAEHRRAQDYYNPGSMGKQYFLGLEKYLGGSGNPAYPGGPVFNFLNFGKNEKELGELKVKEVKNGRLAMIAMLGYFIQAIFTGVGPFQNLLDHLKDPVHNNVLTNLKIH